MRIFGGGGGGGGMLWGRHCGCTSACACVVACVRACVRAGVRTGACACVHHTALPHYFRNVGKMSILRYIRINHKARAMYLFTFHWEYSHKFFSF